MANCRSVHRRRAGYTDVLQRMMLATLAFTLASAVASPSPRSISLGADGSRISVLTSRVLRLEIGEHEDQPTITFPQRESQPVPSYTHTLTADSLTLKTAEVELRLAVPVSHADLGCHRLNVTLALTPGAAPTVVCPGTATGRAPTDPAFPGVVMDQWTDLVLATDSGNLNGSVDTTDCYCGPDCCFGVLQSRMQKGLLSRDGFSVVDDSSTALWDGDASWDWRKPRPTGGKDLYMFLHGRNYRAALQDFVALAGPT